MYQALLDRDYNSILVLLDYLFQRESTQCTIRELDQYFELNRKTITRLVHMFMEDAEKEGWQEVQLQVNESGLRYKFEADYHPNRIYSYYVRKSLNFQLLDQLFNDCFKSLHHFAEEHHSSLATVSRRVTKLRQLLSDYDLTLKLHGGQGIVGPEHQIRYFYTSVYWHIFSDGWWPFPTVDREDLLQALKQVPVILPGADEIALMRYQFFLAVGIVRSQQGCGVTFLPETCQQFCSPALSYARFQQLPQGSRQWQTLISDSREARFSYFCFCAAGIAMPVTVELDHQQVAISAETTQWLEHFLTHFQFQPTAIEMNYLRASLELLHAMSKVWQGIFYDFGKGSSEEVLALREERLYQEMDCFTEGLLREPVFVQLAERNPHLLFQYMLIARPVISHYQFMLRVLVLSKVSYAQRKWLSQQVQKYAPVMIEIVTSLAGNWDVAVADFPIGPLTERPEKIITIHPIPTERDWQKVSTFLQEWAWQSSR